MKTNKIIACLKPIFMTLLAMIIMLPLTLKAQKMDFLKSNVVPAAEGYVKIKTDENNNNVIKIRISNLAEIERFDPTMQTNVVWMETNREKIENIGLITSSNNLKASFNAISSYQPIRIFITAEKDESTQTPSSKVVLTTDSFWEE